MLRLSIAHCAPALAALFLLGLQAAPAPLGLGQVVIITGPPGSGKSLQAHNLSKKYKVPVVSVAELVQGSMKNHGGVGGTVQATLASGEFLSDEAAIDLISGRVGQTDAGKGFILDGYPVSEAQAKFLDSFVAKRNLLPPKVVVLEAPDNVVRERMLKRKRADDTPANIDRRLKEYHAEEAFLNSWYKPENTVRVDASKPPMQVFLEIEEGLVELFAKKGFKGREPASH